MTIDVSSSKWLGGVTAAAVMLVGAFNTTAEAALTYGNPLEQREPVHTVSRTAPCKVAMLRGNGALVELLVTCRGRSVMVSFSPVSNEYCDPKMRCYQSLSPITERYMRTGH